MKSSTFVYEWAVFSSPGPKALGELIGWDSSRRPSMRSHFQA